MAIKRGFAVGDSNGPDAFFEGANFVEALSEAEKFYPKHTYIEFQGDMSTLDSSLSDGAAVPNAPKESAARMPELALKNSGLGKMSGGKLISRVDFDRVMAMSEQEAFERLKPIFRYKYESGPYKGRYVGAYDTLSDMRSSFLTENFKLEKGKKAAGIEPGYSKGVALLPHRLAGEYSKRNLPMAGQGLCVGSSRACRETCLVYSGKNPIVDEHGKAKLVRTEALILEPEAWTRMFVAAIEKHIVDSYESKDRPYIRPNLLSDIPWEMVCPELFEGYFDRRKLGGRMRDTRLSLYDYTKVPRRDVSGINYDLTFSFSGVNEDWCLDELKRGRRVAVVYWLRDKGDSVTRKVWNGYKVFDGDKHDMRPLDPDGVVIGLTYKVVYKRLKSGLERQVEPPKFARKFIMETFFDTDTGDLMVAATPASLGVDAALDAYVAPNEVAIES